MFSVNHAPVLIVVMLLTAGFIVPLLGKKMALGRILFLSVGLVVVVLSLLTTFAVLESGTIVYAVGGWPAPHGIELVVDAFAAYSSLVISVISLIIYWFVVFAPREVKHEAGYYALILLLSAAMHGIVMTGDIFNLFVFVEISSLAAVAIIAVKGTKESIEASFRYLMLSALGSGGMLFGIALLFMITGQLSMEYMRVALSTTAGQYPLNLLTALGFMVIGFGIKSALFPLHIWLPDAHANAPTGSSALLSGLVVKVYIIAFMRIAYMTLGMDLFYILPLRQILLVLASLSILAGSVFAIVQDNIKRLLAFSTVAQVGYIFLGFSLLTERAVEGAIWHILIHAIMKTLLFLAVGVVIHQSGYKKISQIHGLARRMPFTFACITLGALSMVGIPGTAGFISKLYLALGALDAGQAIFAVLILASSLLSAIYYFPLIITAYFGHDALPNIKEPSLAVRLPLAVLSLAILFYGLMPSMLLPLVRQTALLITR